MNRSEILKYSTPGLLVLGITLITGVFIFLNVNGLFDFIPSPKSKVLYPIRYILILLFGVWVTKQNAFNFKKSSWKTYASALLLTLLLIFLAAFINVMIDNHISDSWIQKSTNKVSAEYHLILAVILAPILEELFYRGVFLNYLIKEKLYSKWFCICLSALFFGVIHINPGQILFNTIMGTLYGYYFYKTRNVSVTILCHAFQNLIFHLINY